MASEGRSQQCPRVLSVRVHTPVRRECPDFHQTRNPYQRCYRGINTREAGTRLLAGTCVRIVHWIQSPCTSLSKYKVIASTVTNRVDGHDKHRVKENSIALTLSFFRPETFPKPRTVPKSLGKYPKTFQPRTHSSTPEHLRTHSFRRLSKAQTTTYKYTQGWMFDCTFHRIKSVFDQRQNASHMLFTLLFVRKTGLPSFCLIHIKYQRLALVLLLLWQMTKEFNAEA